MAGIAALLMATYAPTTAHGAPEPPRVLLFIGDGMGAEHRTAATWYSQGLTGTLTMDTLPVWGMTGTACADREITDSAAAATALATGVKTNYRWVSVAPDGTYLVTILERAQARGMAVGLVTNVPMAHATPAAFAAHTDDRTQREKIARQMVAARVNVMLGGGRDNFPPSLLDEAQAAGYTYVSDAAGLAAVDVTTTTHLLGLFAAGGMSRPYDPSLEEMTETAIEILSRDPDGFFLMVEGGQIDWASHQNDAPNTITDTVTFDDAVRVGVTYAEATNAQLIITGDHETGGMGVSLEDTGDSDVLQMPDGSPFYVTWSTTGHTGVDVPTTAVGPWATSLGGRHENTHVHDVMLRAITELTVEGPTTLRVSDAHTYTASVVPSVVSDTYTYTWETTDHVPFTTPQALTGAVSLRWSYPGPKTITVTTSSHGFPLTSTHTVTVTGMTLQGPKVIEAGRPHTYTAAVVPATATDAYTYTWRGTDLTPLVTTHPLSSSVALEWPTPGFKSLTVTATTRELTLTTTQEISVTEKVYPIYFPLLRKISPPR